MTYSDIRDPLFREAVEAIDRGDLATLSDQLTAHPRLVRDRTALPEKGYFDSPYLMWFVADNPIRIPAIPPNIGEVTRTLIGHARKHAPDTFALQIDVTLGLVATGRIPKECGVQIAMMDLLIDSGATPGDALGAIAHGNPEAAAHLVRRGSELTFAAAVGLGWEEDVKRLAAKASTEEWKLALIIAGFRGNAEMIRYLLQNGAPVNQFPTDFRGFHSHAGALHQAVASGSLDSVKLLAEAGAYLQVKDGVYQGTPLDWAIYLQTEDEISDEMKARYHEIETYLRSAGG